MDKIKLIDVKSAPWNAQLSGLSDEDVAYYIERNQKDEDE